MDRIPSSQIHARLRAENPWWGDPSRVHAQWDQLRPRAYLRLFRPLVVASPARRAVVLMGPRRVGKTVLLHHTIREILNGGTSPRQVAYVSLDHPIYNGLGLEDFLDQVSAACELDIRRTPDAFVFLDEIQYLRNWEVHLKAAVDDYPTLRLVTSGSAAAALKLKSTESGAGRFTDFLLPPLTFHEYLELLDEDGLVGPPHPAGHDFEGWYAVPSITALNSAFLRYLNFGGYPEVVLNPAIQQDAGRFIKGDIVDKVLLRDLPSLYGIESIPELNYLFTTLAYNTANEVSLDELARNSGVAKNTLKRYIEYLEAAFLIKVVHRVDRSGKRFQRANFFKVYLTNPSIRSALFAPIAPDDDAVGRVAETGIFAQWFHETNPRHYARWKNGEVDIVQPGARGGIQWAVEVKWSDRYVDQPEELTSLLGFARANGLTEITVTSRTRYAVRMVGEVRMAFVPAGIYCYAVGRNVVMAKDIVAPSRVPATHHQPELDL